MCSTFEQSVLEGWCVWVFGSRDGVLEGSVRRLWRGRGEDVAYPDGVAP